MQRFEPDFVFFEQEALDYPLGRRLYERFLQAGVPIRMIGSHNRVTGIPGESEAEKYRNAKRTLVVGVRRTLDFDTSRPSAEYAIPLTTGCAGHCHYCYLQTTLSAKPYVRVYVNLDEILARAKRYIEERAPETTRFEAACTGDPVSLEHLTGSLRACIEFMADQPFGRLRFVTKFADVGPLLDVRHGGHTRIRFSVNAADIVRMFEPATSSLEERIDAAVRVAEAGYPIGFVVAPIFKFDGWQDAYLALLTKLRERLKGVDTSGLTFELIQHRFTRTAKNTILKRYPKTRLVMDETDRQMKWGRYGRFKYVYKPDVAGMLEGWFQKAILDLFPEANIDYFV